MFPYRPMWFPVGYPPWRFGYPMPLAPEAVYSHTPQVYQRVAQEVLTEDGGVGVGGGRPRQEERYQAQTSSSSPFCKFCKSNNETPEFYSGHDLMRDGKVMCPVLRKHVCENCGATGDEAHTRKYCPHAQHAPEADAPSLAAAGKRKEWYRRNDDGYWGRRRGYEIGRSAAGGYTTAKF